MARALSPFTAAVRTLLTERKGNITHAEARPLLAEMGVELASANAKSENLLAWEKAALAVKSPEDKTDADAVEAYHQKVAAKCGFDEKTAKKVIREAAAHKLYENERNMFNVAKSAWGKMNGATPRASKSEVKAGRKAAVRKAVAVGNEVTIEEAIEFLKANGGVSKVQQKIEALRADADNQQRYLDVVAEARKALAAA